MAKNSILQNENEKIVRQIQYYLKKILEILNGY